MTGRPAKPKRAPPPGSRWRVLAWKRGGRERVALENEGEFDELVVSPWLHVERMNRREWWAQVGDAYVSVSLPRRGRPIVHIRRDEYWTRTARERRGDST